VKNMANDIYEFGGVADVLLKFKTDLEVCGTHYLTGEPYTYLKDVNIRFGYSQQDSLATARKNVLSANSARPNQISIGNVPFSQKIADLMLTRDEATLYSEARKNTISCEKDGELIATGLPIEGTVFVYDKSFIRQEVNGIDNSIIHGNFEVGNTYLVFYQELATGAKYSFEVPHYPYFQADIFMKGNVNKITNDVYMHFDALSLISVPNFNIISGGMLNTPLVFNVIYQSQPEPIIVFKK